MTEYDFSPEAYERYLEKQNNIARWVDKTRRYVPSNPFFPTTPAAQHAALNTHGDRTEDPHQSNRHNRSHSSHSSHSSKHQPRRQPPSSHHRSASHSIPTAPPAQWQPVVDRRSDAHYRRAPQHNVVANQQHYSSPPRPLRSSTAPVYLYPAQGRTSYATAYPNPPAPHSNTRRGGPGRSSRSSTTTHIGTSSNTSKREPLFRRLFGGFMGRHGHESGSYTVRGRRRDSV